MLGLEPKTVRITWSVLVTLSLALLAYTARHTILIFLLAVFFAYLLHPIVSLVDRFGLARRSRTLSLAFVYMLLIALLASAGFAVGSRAAREASNLIDRMPELAKSAGNFSNTPLPPWLEPMRGKALETIRTQFEGGLEHAVPLLRTAIGSFLVTLGNVGFALLIPILSFFFLKDGEELRAGLLREVTGSGGHTFFEGLLDDMHAMLGQYIRALFLLSLATFIAFETFFEIAGVPYAALLATIAAILEFIPVVGPLAAAITACIVALISGYTSIGPMILFFVLYRLFQDYVLQPFLLGSGLALHPLLIVFGALAGEQVAGIPGMLFSVPVMATARLIYVRATRQVT